MTLRKAMCLDCGSAKAILGRCRTRPRGARMLVLLGAALIAFSGAQLQGQGAAAAAYPGSVFDLNLNTHYTFAVAPATVPGHATGVSAIAFDSSVEVSWTAPESDGGSVVTGYTVTSSPGSKTCATYSATSTSCMIDGLDNGTEYTFTVVASNSVGDGDVSVPSSSVTPVAPATVPGHATGVSAIAFDSSVEVSWTAPESDGGSVVTAYTVTSSPGSKTCATDSATSTSCMIDGLDNGTEYSFTVVASNSVGDGSASAASSSVTPVTNPGAPTGVSATAGNASASVSWTAPSSTGGASITAYTVTSSPGGRTCTTNGAGRSCSVTGLTNGTSYTFTVVATNSVGKGSASAASSSVTPATTPSAPRGVSATAGNASARVSWRLIGNNGGSRVTAYTVTSSPGNRTCTTGPLLISCRVTGLTNGTGYTFKVVATNRVGKGSASAASSPVTPAANPGAPTGVSAVSGDVSAAVSWTAPASDGGAAITAYTVTSSPGGQTCTTDRAYLRSCRVYDLANGRPYTFTVVATSSVGDSPASAASSPVTPRWVPRPGR